MENKGFQASFKSGELALQTVWRREIQVEGSEGQTCAEGHMGGGPENMGICGDVAGLAGSPGRGAGEKLVKNPGGGQ